MSNNFFQPKSTGAISVNARSNIYAAGKTTVQDGILPPVYNLTGSEVGKPNEYITMAAFGSITAGNGFIPYNGPDGLLATNTNINSFDGISGIIHNKALFLVGLFLDDSQPQNPAPTRLNFTNNDNFTQISPELKQVFFIGDGYTNSGQQQKFYVPQGATRFYLGFADGDSFRGNPGAYNDNWGNLSANFKVNQPYISINDVMVQEGDAGVGSANFVVSLSESGVQPITVNYVTTPDTATGGSDFAITSGVLTFNAGETSKTISIQTIDDTQIEPTETFKLNLSSASAASISDGEGVATIIDNDLLSAISIGDFGATEGINNNITAVVSLDKASNNPVKVAYTTIDGSAIANSDYVASSGTLTFAPGQTNKNISISVIDDNVSEADLEKFKIILTNPSSTATIADGEGLGTIADTVYSSSSFTLTPKVENLYLTGTTNIDGTGNNSDNYLTGSLGNNYIKGLEGNDTLRGGVGNDTLEGGNSNDSYIFFAIGGIGSDVIVENPNAGVDTLDFTGTAHNLKVDLGLTTLQKVSNPGTQIALQLSAADVMDNVVAGNGSDTIVGNTLNNNLAGGAAADQLFGNAGNDTLTGGAGNDSFVFGSNQAPSLSSVGVDRVTDFNSGDKIVLSKTTFGAIATLVGNSLNVGDFAALSYSSQVSTSSASIVYSTTTGQLFYNPDGATPGFGNGGQFALVSSNPTLTSDSFAVIV